ncbi:ectonucleotide pyrophosphatase/phosphodiesterase [Bacteroides sp. OttesenSCG-928-J23]|nr:ectonucleotide pyrophosphatase/phosphodiesterase [Bacteroides sp. OttesenSCG-928-J23]MDL2291905.1 ectonucleotide pyrophosphatase/phosphodiesterase [Bacteroides sp. OttesenSCG-928-F21]
MKKIFALLSLCLILFACSQSEKETNIPPKDEKHYTIIVSLDGFRWDYPTLYETPNLNKMAEAGVSAIMLPSYPASTFPNHYTIATGLVPDHNGLVNNSFWDPETKKYFSITNDEVRYNPHYYLGEPIWITAQKQGVKTGVLYWVGSDVPIKNSHPTYYKVWNDYPQLTDRQRIDTAIEWLQKPEEERPQLIMIYYDEPDGKGHTYGPVSNECKFIVNYLDNLMGTLMDKISKLPIADRVNLIVTSDHGMTEISKERYVDSNKYLKSEWYDRIAGNTPTSIFTKKEYRETVYNTLKSVEHIRVWKKEDIPAELNYGTSNRLGDIVVAPELGWQFSNSVRDNIGAHGYFPESKDMQVIFYAYGPDFKENYTGSSFVNVDIYPLLAHLLKITPETTDGKMERVKQLLK